ncbi:MAG: SpoIIE family protein phosphatase [Methylacidiphilales bacterium]|nr:SpoIIE family protein phosphatase [Candidatus Methylacidiphilales bacterium]
MNTRASQNITVLDLPYFDVQVSDSTPGSEVAGLFEQNPSLPGIIVMSKDRFRGMVSRNQFFHRLGRLFGIEVYSTRPITAFLDSLTTPALVASADATIQSTAIRCLARPVEFVYDPFVINLRDKPPRLVEFLALILKQTELLTIAQDRLENELAEATSYVRGLLPKPLTGSIETNWCYLPSSELGGDGFGYHWLDPETLAVYLLDVSGHGVGSALLSISVLNVLRTQLLAGTDFRDPSAVLESLNRAFPLASNNDKYFTIWYGVYHQPSRTLTYASGGQHPALLVSGQSDGLRLQTKGPGVGVMPDLKYPSAQVQVPSPAELYLFSDGVYEIAQPDGNWQSWEEFSRFLHDKQPPIETIIQRMRELHGAGEFEDDFSLLKMKLS